MAIHFNIVTTQFLSELKDYNESVERISNGVVHFLHQIKKLSFQTERMAKYNSVAIEICNEVKVTKEILHFVNPIKCCDVSFCRLDFKNVCNCQGCWTEPWRHGYPFNNTQQMQTEKGNGKIFLTLLKT